MTTLEASSNVVDDIGSSKSRDLYGRNRTSVIDSRSPRFATLGDKTSSICEDIVDVLDKVCRGPTKHQHRHPTSSCMQC